MQESNEQTLEVITTDCICSCKFTYYTISAMVVAFYDKKLPRILQEINCACMNNVAVSFIDGGNRRTRRKPPTCR